MDFEQIQQSRTVEKLGFAELQEEIKQIAIKLADSGRAQEYTTIVEEVLGVGKKVSEATPKQIQQLEVILDDLKDIKI